MAKKADSELTCDLGDLPGELLIGGRGGQLPGRVIVEEVKCPGAQR